MLISFGDIKERLPIIIVDGYVVLSLFIYFFGPINFDAPYSDLMALYLLVFLIIINVSYFRAIWKFKNLEYENVDLAVDNHANTSLWNPLPTWFYVFAVVIPLIMVISAVLITGFSGLDGSLFSAMAQAYAFTQSGGKFQDGIDIPMWIYMHLAIFVYLTIIDGLLFFKENNMLRKLLWILSIALLLAYFILFRGAQKTLGDIFVLCSSAVLVKMYCSNAKNMSIKGVLAIFVMTTSFATILATVMGNRINLLNQMGYPAFPLNTQFWQVDLDNLLIFLLPDDTKIGFACEMFYLCNGLCGLSYCLGCPLTWTYGLSTFPDLGDILGRRMDIDVYQSTYMYEAYQMYGWHHSEQWHSIFPYLASDWTFLGALIIMGGVAYIYGICWLESLRKQHKESFYMFCMLNIIWIYLPCNNQIFATRTTALVFLICVVMWMRRKRNAYTKRNIE